MSDTGRFQTLLSRLTARIPATDATLRLVIAVLAMAAAVGGGGVAIRAGFQPLPSMVLAAASGLAATLLATALIAAARWFLWECRRRLERVIVAAVERSLAKAAPATAVGPSTTELAPLIDGLRQEISGLEQRLGESLSRARYEIEDGTMLLAELIDSPQRPACVPRKD